jgi:quercetin dioxygenase-like cupin family protein
LRPILLLVAALSLVVAASAYATTTIRSAHTSAAEPVVRTVLGEAVSPPGAAGRTLALSRVTIAPGSELALHRHPGTQVSTIEHGTLTYWVVRGSVTVTRNATVVRKIDAGQHGQIPAGDTIVERPTTTHHAANRGRTRVVITIASLFRDGAPPSIPVTN